jgi:hypothetical protein
VTSNVVDIGSKPELSPEDQAFRDRMKALGKRFSDALFISVNETVGKATSGQAAEIKSLRERVERLERAYPREVESGE